MKNLVGRLKKDLSRLQETLQKEGDLLIKNLKKTVESSETKEAILEKTRDVEKVIEQRLKQFEPAINNFMTGVRSNAQKYGIDVSKFETRITSAAKAAKTKMASRGKKRSEAKSAKIAKKTKKKSAASTTETT